MKCPQCGIHYDDSERECPMCGASKPLFAKDSSKLAKTTAKAAQSETKKNPHVFDIGSKSDAPKDGMGSILDLGSSSKKKKGGGKVALIFVILIVLLVNGLPWLLGMINNLSISYPIIKETITDSAFEVVDVAPIEEIEILPFHGTWQLNNGPCEITIYPPDGSELSECYEIWDVSHQEAGLYYAYSVSPDEPYEIWEQIDPQQYDVWSFTTFPYEIQNSNLTEEELQAYLENALEIYFCRLKGTEDTVFLYDMYGTTVWMESQSLIPLNRVSI